MTEGYSKNVTVLTSTAIPINNITMQKGCTSSQSGASAIKLSKCGVYMVSVDASVVATTAGTISFQLQRDGVLVPQAVASETAADTTGVHSMSFSTLVQVNENDIKCNCCTSPTIINVINVGVGATFTQFNITVTKIC